MLTLQDKMEGAEMRVLMRRFEEAEGRRREKRKSF